MMSLWRPYEDQLRNFLRDDGAPSVSMAETHLSVSITDRISSYPAPAPSPGVTLTSDSLTSSGSAPVPYKHRLKSFKVKWSRPFTQMTKSGTNAANLQEYYTKVQKTSNPKMRRQVCSRKGNGAEQIEKRLRNNVAAKKSRAVRKMKEDQLAVYLAWLEEENKRLSQELESANELLKTYVIQRQ